MTRRFAKWRKQFGIYCSCGAKTIPFREAAVVTIRDPRTGFAGHPVWAGADLIVESNITVTPALAADPSVLDGNPSSHLRREGQPFGTNSDPDSRTRIWRR